MDNNSIKLARRKLSNYIEKSNHRKTPERYAILEAVYDMKGHFSLKDLNTYLLKKNFPVSRATLYNTLNLFLELRLVVKHTFSNNIRYEACMKNEDHCHQICTMCGKVVELNIPEVTSLLDTYHYRRFRKDEYTLYIYGICSSCQAKLTRNKNEYTNKKTYKS